MPSTMDAVMAWLTRLQSMPPAPVETTAPWVLSAGGPVALSDLEPWTVYAGVPAIKVKERQRFTPAS